MSVSGKGAEYWKRNLNLVALCLAIWFVCSYLFGIILVEPLNAIKIGGYKLGFWFAHMGWFLTEDYDEQNTLPARDLTRFPELVWLDRYYWLPTFALALRRRALPPARPRDLLSAPTMF